MDQNNTPNYENEPYQPPSTGPEQPLTEGAQVYDPNFQPSTGPAFSPPPPSTGPTFTPPPPTYGAPVQPPKNNSRRIWLIVLIVLLVLCCCCLLALIIAWNTGDSFLIQMCVQDPTLPFCQGLMP